MSDCRLKWPMTRSRATPSFVIVAWFVTAVVLSVPTRAQTQTPTRPDAGQVLRELDRPKATPPPAARETVPIVLPPEPPAAQISDDTKITVTTFNITGSSVFSAATLQALLHQWQGRELTLTDLQAAAARITRHYREHGYLVARAYLPAQTLHNGTLDIVVSEGRIGQLVLQNNSRVAAPHSQRLAGQIKPGTIINEAALESTLLSLNETPGIGAVNAALQPGASVGLSDLIVSLQAGPLVTGGIDASNYGNRYTGTYLAGATLNLNSPLHLGDQLSARIQASNEALHSTRLAYRLPLGSNGLLAGAAWSDSTYQLGQNFAALQANGDARINSIFASYPLVRSRIFTITGALTLEQKSLQDRVDSVATAVSKKIRLTTAGLSGDGRWRHGDYLFSIAYTGGNVDIQTPDALASDEASARTNGHYDKLTYAARARLPVSNVWSVSALISGQHSGKNLDSSEKFSLGGADGVRAYPQGEAAADDGCLVTVELRYALPSLAIAAQNPQISGFIDTGMVRINHSPFASGGNRRHLSGIGFGLHWAMFNALELQLGIAWKLSQTDATSDSERSARAWLQAVKYF